VSSRSDDDLLAVRAALAAVAVAIGRTQVGREGRLPPDHPLHLLRDLWRRLERPETVPSTAETQALLSELAEIFTPVDHVYTDVRAAIGRAFEVAARLDEWHQRHPEASTR
jgi:hypothetical protein